jgi:hypothetical protein
MWNRVGLCRNNSRMTNSKSSGRCWGYLLRLGVIVTFSLSAANICAAEGLPRELPDAPAAQTSTTTANSGTSSISGTITDSQGAAIVGATITLEDATSHDKRTALTDNQGWFHFAPAGAGLFSVTIEAKGFAPVVKTGISVRAGESFQLSPSAMQITAVTSTVQVDAPTQYELAEAQLKAQEKQRFLWVVPNFYVSFVSNPAPLSAGQKMRLAFRATIDPYQFINQGINAGWEQWRNDYPGYGQGVAGFAKRYGAAYGNVVSGTIVGAGIMPALLHQDPRYLYKGTGSIPSRIGYALFAIVRTKGDNGKWQPDYSAFTGDIAAGLISNSYLPKGDRKAATNVVSGAVQGFAFRGIGTLEEEFLARWVTTHSKDRGTIGHE